MNTKTDGISSELVAEFWLSIDCIGERYLCFSEPKDSNELHPLVRLSDAEAIISAKDAEIERREVINDKFFDIVLTENEEQTERIKELESELETERMRLAGCGVAALGYFDGCKDEYRSASLDDTLRLYAKYEKQSAALKLAREAIELEHDFGCCALYVERRDEALAAIDALGENGG